MSDGTCRHCGSADPENCGWEGEPSADGEAPCGAIMEADDGAEYVPPVVTPDEQAHRDEAEAAHQWREVCEVLEGVKDRYDAYDRAGATGLNARMVVKWIKENGL